MDQTGSKGLMKMQYEQLITEIVASLQEKLQQKPKQRLLVVGMLKTEEQEQLQQKYQLETVTTDKTEVMDVLITQLSLTMLGNLACGCGGTIEDRIYQALLSKKTVSVLESGISYRNYQNHGNPLVVHYRTYESKLWQYGIQKIASLQELCMFPGKSEWDFTKKRVLVEADLMQLQEKRSAVICVKENCRITPLAKDLMQQYQMNLKRL